MKEKSKVVWEDIIGEFIRDLLPFGGLLRMRF